MVFATVLCLYGSAQADVQRGLSWLISQAQSDGRIAGSADLVTPPQATREALKTTATADRATTRPATSITVPVLHNDHDPNGEALRLTLVPPLTPQITPMGGVVTLDDRGTPADPSDDGLYYAPTPGFIGIETLTYQVRNPSGHTDRAMVRVQVSPIAPRGTTLSVRVDRDRRPLVIDVLALAHAPNGEALDLRSVSQPAHGTVTLDDGQPPGDSRDAWLMYTPEAGFSGIETLTYWVCNASDRCEVATVTFRMPPLLPDHPKPARTRQSLTTPRLRLRRLAIDLPTRRSRWPTPIVSPPAR